MVWKLKKPNIEFITPHKPLLEIAPPVPAGQMLPDWFSAMSNDIPDPGHEFPRLGDWIKDFKGHTVKKCPAVIDFLTEGYIIPLWCDILIQKQNDKLHWENNELDIGVVEFHNYQQAPTYPFKENDYKHPLKFISPWWFKTPPGWSMLFMQPQLHFQKEFSLLPGIVETDSFHQTNFPGIWHREGDTILKRGIPFIHVIPFKRTKHSLLPRIANEVDRDTNAYEQTALRSKFVGGYREITRRFRKNIK